jgi:beta-glucosidase
MSGRRLPDDFAWGVATAAYQIEGARNEDGKGDSIWDRFSDLGRLSTPGDVATDHYHRWEEDLDLLSDLGVNSYRFSVSWPRVIPDGDGQVNGPGLDFYRRLVQGLRERGITPYLTLYHWDLPQALQESGGWVSRETVTAFDRYADIVSSSLGEWVGNWITQNEPWVASIMGYRDGVFAPGVADWPSATAAAHHLLLSHGLATSRIRENVAAAEVGIAIDCRPVTPATESEEDVAAARHFDGFRNRWFFDPVFGRGYPEDTMRAYVDRGVLDPSVIRPGDLDVISTPIDFLGLNYYTTVVVGAGGEEEDRLESSPGPNPPPGYTETGWRIDPQGLRGYLGHLWREYRPGSILVTENGASYSTGPDDEGVIDDRERIEYLAGHVAALADARSDGVGVDGYFVWSFMDNLEWLDGFSQRFGLVWVDPETKTRIPKASFRWYSDLVRSGTLSLP